MKIKQQGLQKFTETEIKIIKLLSLEKITPSDLELLSQPVIKRFLEIISEKFNTLKGTERDKFYNKIEPITTDKTKNEMWESNHFQITCAISTLMQEYGRMRSKTELAAKTELSRQTIHKHLNEYSNHSQYLGEVEQFRFMTSKVLAKVFKFAVNGDMRAAKLYFNVMGNLNNGQTSNSTLIRNQNNYIQINGIVLDQEAIKQLNPHQLNIIEGILKTAILKET